MKSIFSKVAMAAVIAIFFSLSLNAATLPNGDTTKMSKMSKMDKKMSKKKPDKMKMKKKDTMSKM